MPGIAGLGISMSHPPKCPEASIPRTNPRTTAYRCGMLLFVLALAPHEPAHAQGGLALPQAATSAAHVHVEQVATRFADTPSGLGLLPTAAAEVEVAIQHAGLALADSLDLDGMKRHADHVLHALDPALAPVGPGLGYGVRRAVEGILEHIQLAGAAEDASDNVRTHAEYIAGAARSALERIERVVSLASRVRSATTAAEAASLVRGLEATTRAVWAGQDADRDGRIVWDSPEGGLRQVQQHMTLLRRGEGLDQEGFRR